MEQGRAEDEEEEEEFPPFGDSQSDYDTVSKPRTCLNVVPLLDGIRVLNTIQLHE